MEANDIIVENFLRFLVGFYKTDHLVNPSEMTKDNYMKTISNERNRKKSCLFIYGRLVKTRSIVNQ